MSENFERKFNTNSPNTEHVPDTTSPLRGFEETTGPTQEDINASLENRSGFECVNGRTYLLGMQDGEPYFTVTYKGALPKTLSADEKSKFTPIGDGNYKLEYGNVPKQEKSSEPYTVKEPLKHEGYEVSDDQKINEGQLAEIVTGKKVVFYTGAGISEASKIHNLRQLMEEMEIDLGSSEDGFLKTSASNPEEIAVKWKRFKQSVTENPPTLAHESLTNIARQTNSPVITENHDVLHERAGTKAFHVSGPKLQKQVKAKELKEIDAVVTIGLSRDDRGFLAWYKEHNPNGKIIAINKQTPDYIGDEDMILEGDLQQSLPKIEKLIAKQ